MWNKRKTLCLEIGIEKLQSINNFLADSLA